MFKKVIKKLNRKISNEILKEIFSLYHNLWDRVGLHYKNAERLLPVVIFKLQSPIKKEGKSNKFFNSFHLKLENVYKSYQRRDFFLYIWMVYPYYKKIFKL